MKDQKWQSNYLYNMLKSTIKGKNRRNKKLKILRKKKYKIKLLTNQN